MRDEVFISYAHSRSLDEARALRNALKARGVSCFLDERALPLGSVFPEELADGIVNAKVMLVLADDAYFTRPWCLYEFQVCIAPYRAASGEADMACDDLLEHVLLALPSDGSVDRLAPHLPPPLARQNAPRANQTEALADLLVNRLARIDVSIGSRLEGLDDPAVRNLRRGGAIPDTTDLSAITGYLGDLPASLRSAFVGRTQELWQIFHALETQRLNRAPISCVIQGVGGVGKTQLAAEYVWRYAAEYYRGGVCWIDADCDEFRLSEQFFSVLRIFDPAVAKRRDLRDDDGHLDLERLRSVLADVLPRATANGSFLWVIDNLPEPSGTAPVRPMDYWCPAKRELTILCTTRRANLQGADVAIALTDLTISAAVDILCHAPVKRAWLKDVEWEGISDWVGRLPLALRMLHTRLAGGYTSAEDLLAAARRAEPAAAIDAGVEALRGEVAEQYLRGVADAFGLSYQNLDPTSRKAARAFAWLSSEPMPESLVKTIIPGSSLGKLVNRSLVQVEDSRHGDESPGRRFRMHRVVASFLRGQNTNPEEELTELLDWLRAAWTAHERPNHLSRNLFRAHASALSRHSEKRGVALAAVDRLAEATGLPFTAREWAAIDARLATNAARYGFPDRVDSSIVVGSFNIRLLGSSSHRGSGAWRFLADLCRRIDLLAIQEVLPDASGLLTLMDHLGPDYELVLPEIVPENSGSRLPRQRQAFLFRPSLVRRWAFEPPARYACPTDFVRPPLCVGFESLSDAVSPSYRFVAANVHLLWGQRLSETIEEFEKLIAWVVRVMSEATEDDFPNLLLLGSLQQDFERGPSASLLEAARDTLSKSSHGGIHVDFPFLEVHPAQRERFGTNSRMTHSYEQIALFSRDQRLQELLSRRDEMGVNRTGPDYGVMAFSELFSEVVREQSLQALPRADKRDLFGRFDFEVSDCLPLWLRLPLP